MSRSGTGTGFDALDKANRAPIIAISLVMRVPSPLKSIANQVIRSASLVPTLSTALEPIQPSDSSTTSEPSHGASSTLKTTDEGTRKGPPTGACRVRSCAGTTSRRRRALRTTTIPGNPRGRPFRCISTSFDAGRRRNIGAVAVLQSPSSRPRRWGDAGPP